MPPSAPRLRVSLHRLPKDHTRLLAKRVKVEAARREVEAARRTQEDDSCHPGQRDVKPVRQEDIKPVKQEVEQDRKLEDMKLEIAKLDSILQGNLLLDQSQHKISDILLLDRLRLKHEFPGKQGFPEQQQEILKQLPRHPELLGQTEIPGKSFGYSDVCSHRGEQEEVQEEVQDEVQEEVQEEVHEEGLEEGLAEELVACKWEDCQQKLEPRCLLDHLTVREDFMQSTEFTISLLLYSCSYSVMLILKGFLKKLIYLIYSTEQKTSM